MELTSKESFSKDQPSAAKGSSYSQMPHTTLAASKTVLFQAKGNSKVQSARPFTKGIGLTISLMEKVGKLFRMVHFTKDSLRTVKNMGRGFLLGLMIRFMRGNSRMDLCMEKESFTLKIHAVFFRVGFREG